MLLGDSKDTFEATVTVKKKGEVTFASVGGADILALSVNADLPEVKDPSTGINSVKTVEQTNNVIYNLAGQKVNAQYKGIMIQNGKKVLK